MFLQLWSALRLVGVPAVLHCAVPVKLALSSGLVPAHADAPPDEVSAPEAPTAQEPTDASPPPPTAASPEEPDQPSVVKPRVIWVDPPSQVQGKGEPLAAAGPAGPCAGNEPEDPVLGDCRTRDALWSGAYIAIDAGVAQLAPGAAERAHVGSGVAGALRLAIELKDLVILGMDLHALGFEDKKPFSETVQDCTTYEGQIIDCDAPKRVKSHVSAVGVGFEAGLQHRFRPFGWTTWVPGVILGYAAGNLSRGVGCDGCRSESAGATVAGAYVAPFFRITLGTSERWAAVVRYQRFMTGELRYVGTVGIEFGAP